MKIQWFEFDESLAHTLQEREINNEEDARRALNDIKSHPNAEEAMFYLVDNDDEVERELTFHFNAARTLGYAYYNQRGRALVTSSGVSESPEEFTSSGGSFSAGTGVNAPKLEQAVLEFVTTGRQPTAIDWHNEMAPAGKKNTPPFRRK